MNFMGTEKRRFFAIIGIFALSSCSRQPSNLAPHYTENDVRKFVIPGTPRDAIIARFGTPLTAEKNPKFEDGNTDIDEIIYFLLPSAPAGTKEDFVFSGFQVRLKEGKAVQWLSSHRTTN